jgi:hypothetical protein
MQLVAVAHWTWHQPPGTQVAPHDWPLAQSTLQFSPPVHMMSHGSIGPQTQSFPSQTF